MESSIGVGPWASGRIFVMPFSSVTSIDSPLVCLSMTEAASSGPMRRACSASVRLSYDLNLAPATPFYGFSAIVGVAHDVLMVLAFYAIFRYTVNNPFIAAIL
ncbi:MAG: hypothetical protein II661_00310, partial [Bacteroidales bacterium]|nr:hypothetical protein [Bacteroidales bacterium]